MSKVIRHTACPECSKTGNGASMAVYSNGGYCFECGHLDRDPREVGTTEDKPINTPEVPTSKGFIQGTSPDVLSGRGISKEILEHFDYQIGFYTGYLANVESKKKELVTNEPVHIANIYNRSGELQAQQLRASHKRFLLLGTNTQGLALSGTHLYNPNPNVFVTITEGYIDQLSVAQACGKQFPVVTVPCGTGSGEKAIQQDLDWLQGFKYVVLAFDNDDAGKALVEKVLPLFAPGKVRVAAWPQKDANDLVSKGDYKTVKSVLFNAREHKPEGIISLSDISVEDIEKINIKGADLPFPKLNQRIHGLKKNCLYSLVAREKSGKSLVTKEIVLSLIEQGYKVGLFYLEESAAKAATSFIAMQHATPMWQLEEDVDKLGGAEQILLELQQFKDKGVYIYDHKGAIDLESVFNAMQYMVKALAVDYIILDNVSVAIAGSDAAANERKLIDNFVYKCVSLVNNESVSIVNVAHLVKNRKDKDGEDSQTVTRADIFGSGSFAKFSYSIIAIERDPDNNTATLKVLADRGTGFEGYTDTMVYSLETGRLTTRDMI